MRAGSIADAADRHSRRALPPPRRRASHRASHACDIVLSVAPLTVHQPCGARAAALRRRAL